MVLSFPALLRSVCHARRFVRPGSLRDLPGASPTDRSRDPASRRIGNNVAAAATPVAVSDARIRAARSSAEFRRLQAQPAWRRVPQPFRAGRQSRQESIRPRAYRTHTESAAPVQELSRRFVAKIYFRPPPQVSPSRRYCANQWPPPKVYRNIPSGEPDESLVEVVQVLDPRHPLYGRSFRVICRSSHRGGNFPPSYEVEHRGGTSLLVPISVTEPHQPNSNRTKLCIDALCELISAVECLGCDEHRSERS